jgi:chromosome segregation ATPase
MAELTTEILDAALERLRLSLVDHIDRGVGSLRSELASLRERVDHIDGEVTKLRERVDHIDGEVTTLRDRVDHIADDVSMMRPRVDGLPLIGNAIDNLQRDMRLLRAAINDMARTNITAGEVEAMHTDIDRMMARQVELEARIAALERDKQDG